MPLSQWINLSLVASSPTPPTEPTFTAPRPRPMAKAAACATNTPVGRRSTLTTPVISRKTVAEPGTSTTGKPSATWVLLKRSQATANPSGTPPIQASSTSPTATAAPPGGPTTPPPRKKTWCSTSQAKPRGRMRPPTGPREKAPPVPTAATSPSWPPATTNPRRKRKSTAC